MKREAWDHPKFKLVGRDLKLPLCFVRGILESIWMVAGINFPRGDIGRWSNEDIAVAIDYPGDADELVASLLRRKLLDALPDQTGRLYIHDWHKHSDRYVNLRLLNQRQTYANGVPARRKEHEEPEDTAKASAPDAKRHEATRSDVMEPLPVPEPVPEPVPAAAAIARKDSPPPAPPENPPGLLSPETAVLAPDLPAAASPPRRPVPIARTPPPREPPDAAAEDIADVRGWLRELAPPGWSPPDDAIVREVIAACRGHDLEELGDYLASLAKRKRAPGQSYAWFVRVVADHFRHLPVASAEAVIRA